MFLKPIGSVGVIMWQGKKEKLNCGNFLKSTLMKLLKVKANKPSVENRTFIKVGSRSLGRRCDLSSHRPSYEIERNQTK